MTPHRGTLILILGILSLILCFPLGAVCGAIAWIFANSDLRAMRAGTMDPNGRGSTEGGRFIAIIGIIVTLLIGIVWFLLLGLGAVVAATAKG